MVPFSVGWPAWIVSLIGLSHACLKGGGKERLLALGFILGYGFLALADSRWGYYIISYLPFVLLFFAIGINFLSRTLPEGARYPLLAGIIVYHLAYGIAYAQLYHKPNTRELASHWISKNVETGTSIGIFRNFFWTPGIIRQYKSPYHVIKCGDDMTPLYKAILNFKEIDPPAYFVASELETGTFLRNKGLFKEQNEILNSLNSLYTRVAVFELKPQILGFKFWHRDPPDDMLFAAPTITILKKAEIHAQASGSQ
jgi:hypothetical protein